jgi:hypothetical protein
VHDLITVAGIAPDGVEHAGDVHPDDLRGGGSGSLAGDSVLRSPDARRPPPGPVVGRIAGVSDR